MYKRAHVLAQHTVHGGPQVLDADASSAPQVQRRDRVQRVCLAPALALAAGALMMHVVST